MRLVSPLLALTFSLVFGFAPVLRAADAAAPAKPAASSDRDSTELGDHMDDLSDAFKKLRRQVNDTAQNASSLGLAGIMHRQAEAASKLIPAKAQDIPEADRAKFIAQYREQMNKFIGMISDLEAALKANDNERAAKIVKDLGAFQRESHRHFRKPQK